MAMMMSPGPARLMFQGTSDSEVLTSFAKAMTTLKTHTSCAALAAWNIGFNSLISGMRSLGTARPYLRGYTNWGVTLPAFLPQGLPFSVLLSLSGRVWAVALQEAEAGVEAVGGVEVGVWMTPRHHIQVQGPGRFIPVPHRQPGRGGGPVFGLGQQREQRQVIFSTVGEKKEGEWGIRWPGRAAVVDWVIVLHPGLQRALVKQGGGKGKFVSYTLPLGDLFTCDITGPQESVNQHLLQLTKGAAINHKPRAGPPLGYHDSNALCSLHLTTLRPFSVVIICDSPFLPFHTSYALLPTHSLGTRRDITLNHPFPNHLY